MAKSPPTKDLELHPDAWERFERAADVVAKSPPQHRTTAKIKGKANKSGREGSRTGKRKT
jgi:hypothetical protein